jgi:hypothetical protein
MRSEGENTRKNFAAQLNQFRNTMGVGDLVVMPYPSGPEFGSRIRQQKSSARSLRVSRAGSS